jgi:hypothetical protein
MQKKEDKWFGLERSVLLDNIHGLDNSIKNEVLPYNLTDTSKRMDFLSKLIDDKRDKLMSILTRKARVDMYGWMYAKSEKMVIPKNLGTRYVFSMEDIHSDSLNEALASAVKLNSSINDYDLYISEVTCAHNGIDCAKTLLNFSLNPHINEVYVTDTRHVKIDKSIRYYVRQ